MDDSVRRFFEGISGPQSTIPKTIRGTLRFDLADGRRREHWLIRFDKGTVSAGESEAEADCVARTDKATLAAIIEGRMNAMAALLRGAITVEGDTLLLAVFRDLLTATEAAPKNVRVGANTGRRS